MFQFTGLDEGSVHIVMIMGNELEFLVGNVFMEPSFSFYSTK